MAPLPPLPDPVTFDQTLANMRQLQDTFKPDICNQEDPLITFEKDGVPPVLNFNLPQSTAFTTYGRIAVPVDQAYFKAFTKVIPANNYFDVMQAMTTEQAQSYFNTGTQRIKTTSGFFYEAQDNEPFMVNRVTGGHIPIIKNMGAQQAGNAIPVNVAPFNPPPTARMADLAKQNLRPVKMPTFNNQVQVIRYVAKPPAPVPRITIVEEYTTTSYLGNYGAGRVVKTMSLMPGERTTISMRTYKDMVSTRESAQNVLDSMSTESATQLDTLMQKEQGDMTATSDTSEGSSSSFSTATDAHNSTRSFSVSASINFPFGGLGGGYGQSSSDASSNANGWNNANSYGHTGARQSNINTINSALDKHVQSSNSMRQININTSTSDTARSGEEDTTVREIMNYNKSRVINFIFRQLKQEYTVITALTNLKFIYSNGYPESFTVVDLNNLDNMLKDIIMDGNPNDPVNPHPVEYYRDQVKCSLLQHYCKILNFDDQYLDFLDHVTVDLGQCLSTWIQGCTPKAEAYWRVKPKLTDKYIDPDSGNEITVKGVILSVQKQTLQTSSVIADALLGRGEALDCFNQKAQDAQSLADLINNMTAMQSLQDSLQQSAVNLDYATQQLDMGTKQIDQMQVQIDAMQQQIDIMTALDPAEQPGAYKKIFGNCCPTPQYTGGCGCGNCKDE